MIFGFQENGCTIVVGADRKDELLEFLGSIPKVTEPFYSNFFQISMAELDEPAWTFQHKDEEEADKFATENRVFLTKKEKVRKFQDRMIERANDPNAPDPRPLGEVYGVPMRDLAKEIEEAKAKSEEIEPVDHSLAIPDPKHIIYIRVDVKNQKISTVEPLVADLKDQIAVSRDYDEGCWMATHSQECADEIIKRLSHMSPDSWIINQRGKQFLPKGARIVEKPEMGPRPWVVGQEEDWKNLSDEDKKNKIKGDELIFDVFSNGYGSVIHIAPREYFYEHNKLFPESLEIDHLIPREFKEHSPGKYYSKQTNTDKLTLTLLHKGMTEDFLMRMYLKEEE